MSADGDRIVKVLKNLTKTKSQQKNALAIDREIKQKNKMFTGCLGLCEQWSKFCRDLSKTSLHEYSPPPH